MKHDLTPTLQTTVLISAGPPPNPLCVTLPFCLTMSSSLFVSPLDTKHSLGALSR